MKKENVFPTGIASGGGLNKREYFTAQALNGMLSAAYTGGISDSSKEARKAFVKNAIAIADEALELLEKKL